MSKSKTPTFLLELPLQVDSQQAKQLRAHFEAARCLYNALLGEAMKRLKQMRADPRWKLARRLPKTWKQERHALFSQLRQEYGFSEYALHGCATSARTAWQKQYGKSVGAHGPGMFIELLKRTVARTGGILHEVPTRTTKLSQYCHGCGCYLKKKLSERWHHCDCGIGPVQRDLYSAFLAVHLDPRTDLPSIAQSDWESAEMRLRAAIEDVQERANAGEALPQSMGVSRAGARLPRSLVQPHQELCTPVEYVEAVEYRQEPLPFSGGESQNSL